MNKRYIMMLFLLLSSLLVGVGVGYAVFLGNSKVLGSKFTVASAEIKMLSNLTGGVNAENLVSEMAGPEFGNVASGWGDSYLVKVYNNSTSNLILTSRSEYATANDPEELRQLIFVEPFVWADSNNNGLAETEELGTSLGRKSIVKWKTEGFDLGTLTSGEVKGVLLKFSTDTIPSTKQGKSAVFDFEFDAQSF